MNELVQKDLKYIWHPCSQMKDYEELKPIIIEKAKGSYLYDINGKKYLDIISSWWCNLLGHSNDQINDAIKEQLDNLEHVIFANFSHKGAIALCEELMQTLPKGLCKFNFSDNGSASVECSLKMAFQYHLQTGNPQKTRFMCFSDGYHGETIGALSVGAMDLFAQKYKPMLMESIRIKAPHCYRCPFGKCRDTCNVECFADAKVAFEKHAHETAAIIIEPLVQGSAGMRIYPAKYLSLLRELCSAYNVTLIADEIATGFGRTGKMFAFSHTNVAPDIMCLSKSLTGGYMPMSITVTTQKIYDAFYADYSENKAFIHSHTYSGNPLACSATLAVQKILKTQNVIEKSNETAIYLHNRLNELFLSHKNVGEIRHINLINALELVKDKKTKEPFNPSLRLGYQIYKKALEKGLLLRPLGDVLYFNPPLTITKAEIDEAITTLGEALTDILGN